MQTTTDKKATLKHDAPESEAQYTQSTFLAQRNGSVFKKRAIIGCGYVGTALASYWSQKQDHRVTVTTTRQERVGELEQLASQVVVMKGQDIQAVRSLIQEQDTIVLSIAPISDRQVSAEVYRETYVPTAKNLVAALKDAPNVKQLIYLSSSSVYGDKKGEWVDETSPVDTNSEYSQVLCEAEQILSDAASGDLKVTILRLGGIYGPKREIMRRFSRIAGKTLPGTGDTFTSWIHLNDIVGAVDFLCERRLGGIYNLVNDFNCTIRELCDRVLTQQGLERAVWDASQSGSRNLNARISNQKIKAAGYKLIHPKTII